MKTHTQKGVMRLGFRHDIADMTVKGSVGNTPRRFSRARSASILFMKATNPQFLATALCSSVRGHIILTLARGPYRPKISQSCCSVICGQRLPRKRFVVDLSVSSSYGYPTRDRVVSRNEGNCTFTETAPPVHIFIVE